MVRVKAVHDGSIAQELGIAPGTELVSVNGRDLADFLDWEFLTADDELVIEARLPDGEEIVYEIERPEGEAMGVELEPPTIRRCANRCEFCFIEGLPKGLRKPLYVRDDDYRLSRTAISRRSRTSRIATLLESSSTGCRRSISPCTPRPGKRARFCSTIRASRTSSSSSRSSRRAAFSFMAKWSSCRASTTERSSRNRYATSGA